MTDEQLERKMEFIVETLAQVAVNDQKHDIRLSRLERVAKLMVFGRTIVRLLLAVGLISTVAHLSHEQAQGQPTPTPVPVARQAQRPLPPTQYIPAHDYDQRNIKLDLRFDWEREQAIGTATITLAPTIKDLRRVDFDAAYMTVSGATLAAGAPLKFEYDESKQKLTVLLDRTYQPSDELTVVISYHTNRPPAEGRAILGGTGLTFVKPRPDDPKRPRQIWTQGETETNHQIGRAHV